MYTSHILSVCPFFIGAFNIFSFPYQKKNKKNKRFDMDNNPVKNEKISEKWVEIPMKTSFSFHSI